MVYINIPYAPENELIDKDRFIKELTFADIGEEARYEAFAAVYNRLPRGVPFGIDETHKARLLIAVLLELGIGYRISTEPEYI